jgi:hypothetical protein
MVPAAMTSVMRQKGPSIQLINGGIRVTHSEQLAVVNSTVAFTATRILVQPGLSTFSTWLSAQAQNWDQYSLIGFTAEYEPRCGTGNSGSVMLGFDFDPSDRLPANEAAFSSYYNTVETAPYVGSRTSVSRAAVHATGPRKYLRSTTVSGDLRMYDACSLIYTTGSGPAAPILWGKLWVHYTVDLLVATAPATPVITQCFSFSALANTIVNSGANVPVPFGAVVANFNGSIDDSAPPAFSFPVGGSYLVILQLAVYTNVTNGGGNVVLNMIINGVVYNTVNSGFGAAAGAVTYIQLPMLVPFIVSPGDLLVFTVQNGSPNGITVQAGSDLNFLCV